MTASWWLRSFYIPALLPETLIKVTAEHLAVKKLAAETQTESWPHLCKAFSPDQHCLLARQDLIVPVCSVPSLMYLLKMVELLKWLFIFSCFATEICQMLFFFSVYIKYLNDHFRFKKSKCTDIIKGSMADKWNF